MNYLFLLLLTTSCLKGAEHHIRKNYPHNKNRSFTVILIPSDTRFTIPSGIYVRSIGFLPNNNSNNVRILDTPDHVAKNTDTPRHYFRLPIFKKIEKKGMTHENNNNVHHHLTITLSHFYKC